MEVWEEVTRRRGGKVVLQARLRTVPIGLDKEEAGGRAGGRAGEQSGGSSNLFPRRGDARRECVCEP